MEGVGLRVCYHLVLSAWMDLWMEAGTHLQLPRLDLRHVLGRSARGRRGRDSHADAEVGGGSLGRHAGGWGRRIGLERGAGAPRPSRSRGNDDPCPAGNKGRGPERSKPLAYQVRLLTVTHETVVAWGGTLYFIPRRPSRSANPAMWAQVGRRHDETVCKQRRSPGNFKCNA